MSDPTVRVAERVDLIAAETAEGLQGPPTAHGHQH